MKGAGPADEGSGRVEVGELEEVGWRRRRSVGRLEEAGGGPLGRAEVYT